MPGSLSTYIERLFDTVYWNKFERMRTKYSVADRECGFSLSYLDWITRNDFVFNSFQPETSFFLFAYIIQGARTWTLVIAIYTEELKDHPVLCCLTVHMSSMESTCQQYNILYIHTYKRALSSSQSQRQCRSTAALHDHLRPTVLILPPAGTAWLHELPRCSPERSHAASRCPLQTVQWLGDKCKDTWGRRACWLLHARKAPSLWRLDPSFLRHDGQPLLTPTAHWSAQISSSATYMS
jgi:hypothetical protein